jgi:hypothetical protein
MCFNIKAESIWAKRVEVYARTKGAKPLIEATRDNPSGRKSSTSNHWNHA